MNTERGALIKIPPRQSWLRLLLSKRAKQLQAEREQILADLAKERKSRIDAEWDAYEAELKKYFEWSERCAHASGKEKLDLCMNIPTWTLHEAIRHRDASESLSEAHHRFVPKEKQ